MWFGEEFLTLKYIQWTDAKTKHSRGIKMKKIKKTTVAQFRTAEQLKIEAKAEAKARKEAERKRHERNRANNLKKGKK